MGVNLFIFSFLLYLKEIKCMVGCSANGDTENNIFMNEEDTGMLAGHAYSVIDVF